MYEKVHCHRAVTKDTMRNAAQMEVGLTEIREAKENFTESPLVHYTT